MLDWGSSLSYEKFMANVVHLHATSAHGSLEMVIHLHPEPAHLFSHLAIPHPVFVNFLLEDQLGKL